jgi:hypothetical protein
MAAADATEDAKRATIEVRLRELNQLFNSFDPSPFHERDLDDDAENFIVGWAREVHNKGPFHIVVHLPAPEAKKAHERGLGSVIGRYFEYRTGMIERDLRDLFRVGRTSLAIGVGVLAACTALGQVVHAVFPVSAPAQILTEGLTIFGWVANWRPAEIFFYDVWAMRRRLGLYRRLAAAEVEVRAD